MLAFRQWCKNTYDEKHVNNWIGFYFYPTNRWIRSMAYIWQAFHVSRGTYHCLCWLWHLWGSGHVYSRLFLRDHRLLSAEPVQLVFLKTTRELRTAPMRTGIYQPVSWRSVASVIHGQCHPLYGKDNGQLIT